MLIIKFKKNLKDELYLALEADYLHRHGLTLFPSGRTVQYNLLERAQKELALQICRGKALTAVKGFGANKVKQAYLKAQELSQQIGVTPQRFSLLKGQAEFALARGQLQKANQLGENLIQLASKKGEYLTDAYAILGTIFDVELYRLKGELLSRQAGRQTEAEKCLRQSLYIAKSQQAKMLELKAKISLSGLIKYA